MSRPIHIKFDNTLPDTPVHAPLVPSSVTEGGDIDTESSEVKITGVYVPLVKLNNKVIPWECVLRFHLYCTEFIPELSLTILDPNGTILNLDTPGPDNVIVVELLPRFEKIYKKIKLTFYTDNVSLSPGTNTVSLRGVYTCPGLRDSVLEAFGKITTYRFAEEVAHRLHLGLASNLSDSGDERYVYLSGESFLESLQSVVREGGDPDVVLEAWIDWWNNVNIVNIRDLMDGSTAEKLTVWGNINIINIDSVYTDDPVEIPAVITNDYRKNTLPTYTTNLVFNNNNHKNTWKGTDRAYNYYDLYRDINDSVLVQDGTGVKTSIVTRQYYGGEYDSRVGSSLYVMGREYRDMYVQKIENNSITVKLSGVCFGLMRGSHVDLEWYDASNYGHEQYAQNDKVTTNVPDHGESGDPNDTEVITLNKKISGRYLVVGTSIEYTRSDGPDGPESHMYHYLTISKQVETFNYSDYTKNNNI